MVSSGVLYCPPCRCGVSLFTADNCEVAGEILPYRLQDDFEAARRGYYVFGSLRRSSGTMPTDRHFTGQHKDATGLLYYGARYYDPNLGQFISPDTIIPDPARLIDYNRYLYGYGNPVKYNDPTGHETSKPDWLPPFLILIFPRNDGRRVKTR
jgi:RHS repeat-associated protein